MTVIALRPRKPSQGGTSEGRQPPELTGVFRSPTGAPGVFSGSLRLERLILTPHGAFVSGVVTGELTTAGGAHVGRDSRQVTTAAELRRADGRTQAVVLAFVVDMMGIPVRIDSFTLDPGFVAHGARRAHPGAKAAYLSSEA